MRVEKPNRVSRSYTQHLGAPPTEVFPLLCPVREAEWVKDWRPRLVLSDSGFAEPDCVFITPGIPEDALREAIERIFSGKGAKVVDTNLKGFHLGREAGLAASG